MVTACAASRSAAEWSEAAASSSTVEAPALSQREQRAFRRAAVRLDLRLCPSCDAPVQKNAGCNHIRCRCGADFQWSRAKPVVKTYRSCRTYRCAKAVGTGAVVVVGVPLVFPFAVAGAALAGVGGLVYGMFRYLGVVDPSSVKLQLNTGIFGGRAHSAGKKSPPLRSGLHHTRPRARAVCAPRACSASCCQPQVLPH